MSDNRKVQIPVVVDATGAKAGFEEVKQGGRDMAQALQQSAQQAGQAVQKIGDGSAPAAAKLDGATRSIIGSIQRTTAVMEAGGRATAKYYESLAEKRGVNVDVLRPYLAQLDAVQAKQAQATAGMQAQSAAMAGTAVSAKQLQFALRGVPAQMTDIVTSLASGQRPMQVLLQQGGQLKDMFGGIGPAARALGGYVVGLINPFTLGAAAIAGLVYAAHAGSEELRGFQNAATMTGNVMGVSASRFAELRDSIAGIAGTKGKAAEALTAIAQSGLAAGDNVRGIAEAAILMEKATGQSISKTIDQFRELQKSPADAAAKLNEQFGFLTTSVYAQIKALEESGNKTKAAEVAMRSLADVTKDRAATVVDNVGFIERAWRKVLGVLKSVGDEMLDIGRQSSTAQELATVRGEIRAASGQDKNRPFRLPWEPSLEELRQKEANLQEMLRLEQRGAEQAAQRSQVERAGVAAVEAVSRANDQNATSQTKLNKALEEYRRNLAAIRAADPKSALLDPKLIAQTEAGIRKQFTETTGEGGIASQRAAKEIARQENARLQASIDSLDFSTPTKLTEAEKRVIQIQEELKGSLLGVARANKVKELAAAEAAVQDERSNQALQQQYDATKKAREEITRQADTVGQQAEAVRKLASDQEAANAQFGKSKTAIEESTLALLKLQLAEADSSDTFDPRYVAGLRAKVEAQERYVDALQKAEFLQKSRSLDEAGRVAAEETQTLQLEVSLLGRTQQERERIIAQRRAEVSLAKELAEIEKLNLGTGPEADAKRRELQDKARSNARVQAANAEQKAIVDEWQRTTDSINQSLTDALMRGFESGKGFASNLRDTLKNMFGTLVLRPIIQAVMAPVSGALSGIGQRIGGAIIGGDGGLGGFSSSVIGSLAGQLGGTGIAGLGAAISGGFAAGASGSTAFASALGVGNAGLGASGLAEMASAGALVGEGGAAAGIMGGASAGLAAIGPVGWAALGIMAAAAIFGGKGGGPKTESGFGSGVPLRGNPSSAKAIADGIQAQFKAIAGDRAGNLDLGIFSAADPQGTAQTQLAVEARLNGRSLYSRAGRLGGIENVGRSQEELAAAVTEESERVVLHALQETHLPDKIGAYLKQLGDIDKLSGGALEAAVAKVQKAMTQRQTLEQQYFDLTHTELQRLTAAREKERAAIDDTNQALYDTVTTLTDLRAAEARARDGLMAAYERESEALRGVIERNHGFAESLRAVRDGLSLSGGTLTRSQRTALTGNTFQGTLTQALGGSDTAMQGLGDAGRSYVDALKDSARNGVELAAGIARVQAGLTTAAAAADSRATVAQQQLDAMTQQLSALGLINTSVLSVGQALAAFLDAQTAIEKETLRYTAQIAAEQAAADQAAGNQAVAAASAAASPAPTYSLKQLGEMYDAGVIRARGPGDFYNIISGEQVDISRLKQSVNFGDGSYLGPFAASGGLQTTGPVMVGERGEEVVDFETPGRVYTNDQTRGMFASNAALEPLLREIKGELRALRDETRVGDVAAVTSLQRIDSRLKKFDIDGMPAVRV